ncbi:MAG: aminoacyl-histidine dipeptidase [Muribaculaceae bacterium]|nr:aminoacyl-histidine dipeptidase [Muribaculaceae bacterium]
MKITDLKPKLVWECFDEITKVPRPTHHLERMKDFLTGWAERHNLKYATDEVGNVVMYCPATPGYENAPTVVLQGHQDMVAEKRGDVEHDFLTDPIKTIVDGDWVKAEGTTLGADNGLGCASAMAAMIDPDLVHGPLEAVFTVDEEQGLTGATGLDASLVSGRILLNLDSEEHGMIVIGCAGSMCTVATYPIEEVDVPDGYVWYEAHINHLKGGHSGMEIHLGRGNANQILARFLWLAEDEFGMIFLSDFQGGGLPNAIPREAKALIGVAEGQEEALEKMAEIFNATIHDELRLAEGNDFTFSVELKEAPAKMIAEPYVNPLISTIFGTPNGVQGMSLAVAGLVETSSNLASVHKTDDEKVVVTTHQRSSVDSKREEITDRITALYENIGCVVVTNDPSVGWAPNPDSKLLKIAEESFNDLFGYDPKVEALHAGLECGIFLEKMPGMDMISFGPTLKDIHSPNEKAYIPSVEEYWKFLTDILKRLAKA